MERYWDRFVGCCIKNDVVGEETVTPDIGSVVVEKELK
jgi:hypothetical protein